MPPRLTDDDLARIRARAEKATPGPWETYEDVNVWMLFGSSLVVLDGPNGEQVEMVGHPPQLIKAPKNSREYAEYWPNEADSDFIVHARADIPALLADLEEARAALVEAMKQTSSMAGWIAGVLDNNDSNGCEHPLVRAALRWEIDTRKLLGMPPEELPPDGSSPWARAMRKALAATEQPNCSACATTPVQYCCQWQNGAATEGTDG